MKNIHMCRQAKQAGTQVTLDQDLNIPDLKPDVEMIIQSRERVNLEHTRAENGKLYVDGYLTASILYMDDTKERQLHRLETKLTFDEVIHMEGVEAGDPVSLRYEVEDLSVTLINSRKLAIRGLLSFEAAVDEIYDLSAAVETKSDLTLCERRKNLDLLQLMVQKKDIFRLKEEITVPGGKPDIAEILWDQTEIRACQVQPGDGFLKIQGKLFVFVLYRGYEEEKIQWVEQVIPFEGRLDCSGCQEDLIPDISLTLIQMEVSAKEDTDGELRVFHLEGVLELEIRIYGSEQAEILEDVYSPEKKLQLVTEEETYESFVMKNESRCRVEGKIRIQGAKPRILQICHASGSIKIDKTDIVEDGIRIEGAVPVSILYISSDDTRPFAVLEGMIPFSHQAEIPGIRKDCRYSLTTCMEQLSANMTDSEEIELKAAVSLKLFAAHPQKQQCITGITVEDYTIEELEAVPGFTGYIVQDGETLWEIAREYYLTPEQVMEMNGLESDNIQKGDCLILMKCNKILI